MSLQTLRQPQESELDRLRNEAFAYARKQIWGMGLGELREMVEQFRAHEAEEAAEPEERTVPAASTGPASGPVTVPAAPTGPATGPVSAADLRAPAAE